MTNLHFNNIIPGLLLLILAISGNFLADTYSCNLQEIFHTNAIYKNILVFLLMYFTIYFTERRSENPLVSLLKTGIAYICYLFFTKQTPISLLITLGLLVAAFICEQYRTYKNGQSTDNIDHQKIIPKIQLGLAIAAILTTLIGFTINYKTINKVKNTTFITYLFGYNKCN